MKRWMGWFLGAVILGAAVATALLHPIHLPSFETLPHAALAGRVLNLLVIGAVLCLLRVLYGPTAADRIVAVDILGILIVGICGVLALITGHSWYLDIGIVWALQSFIGSLAFAKYLEGRQYDD